MAKIPVGRTVAYAYGFAFKNFWTNLKVIGAPLVIYWVGAWALSQYYLMPLIAPSADGSFVKAWHSPIFIAYFLSMFLFSAAIMSLLTAESLGVREQRSYVYWLIGAPVWKMLLAFVLCYLAMILFALFVSLIGVVLVAVAFLVMKTSDPQLLIGIVTLLIMGVVLLSMFFAAVRFGFLMAPVVIAERRVNPFRAWKLSKGNFWRLFAIFFVSFLPFIVLYAVAIYVFVDWSMFPHVPVGGGPAEIAAWNGQYLAWTQAYTAKMMTYAYVIYPLGFAIAIVWYAMQAGIMAYGYRSAMQAEAA